METEEDRLSLLPQPLIDHILSFLPTKEVIRTTSLLSKKWRQTWKTLPNLHFDLTSPQEQQFVNRALARRSSSSSPLSKFRLTNSSTGRDLGPGGPAWILSAASAFLRELDVNLGSTKLDSLDSLLACRSLESLKLQALLGNPLLSSSFRLANLRVLHLASIGSNGSGVVTVVPSSFPLLEDLSLSGRFGVLDISVPNLRVLLVIAAEFSRIRISSPRLENFIFASDQHGGRFDGDMPSLTSSILVVPFGGAWRSHSVVGQIIGSAGNVLDLNISTCLGHELQASPGHLLEETMCLPTFHKVINLRFFSCLHDEHLEALICLLRHSPNLETLRIQQMSNWQKCYCINKADSWKARLLPNKILGCLNFVKIWDMDGSEVVNKKEFVKFLSINTGVWDGLTLKI